MKDQIVKVPKTITLPNGDTITRDVRLRLSDVIKECIEAIQDMAGIKLLDQFVPALSDDGFCLDDEGFSDDGDDPDDDLDDDMAGEEWKNGYKNKQCEDEDEQCV